MKTGDLVYAVDETPSYVLWEGRGVLIRPDEGRTYVDYTIVGGLASWEILCEDGKLRVIAGDGIEVINESR